MDRLAYVLVWTLIKFLQALPLPVVARLGRCAGELAFWLDKRHRRVALENFRNAFAHERSPAEIQTLAREQFRRLGENYCASAKTASMSAEQLMPHLELVGTEHIQSAGPPSASRIIAIGHFGNFELYARANRDLPQFILATTYRALNQPRLNQLLIRLRTQHGCLVFERRRDAKALQAALSRQPLVLGLLSDQHAGRRGIWMAGCAQPIPPRPFMPCVTDCRCSWPFATEPAWPSGGSKSAPLSPPWNRAAGALSLCLWPRSTPPLKKPFGATPLTGSGCIPGGGHNVNNL
jgi:hypothetical protein